MLKKVKSILCDERGSTFIESGLWIALVVLVMAGAGITLANTIKGKYADINTEVGNVPALIQ